MDSRLQADYRSLIGSRSGVVIEWRGKDSARIKGFGVGLAMEGVGQGEVFLEWAGDRTFDRLCGVVECALVLDGVEPETARKAVDFWIGEWRTWVQSCVHQRQSKIGGNGLW